MKKMNFFLIALFISTKVFAQEVEVSNVQAGSLETAIKAKGITPQEVTRLTITSGDLNGIDIRLLRYMGGSDENASPTEGYTLNHLDFGGARIVAGGDFYVRHNNISTDPVYTKNDTLTSGMFVMCENIKSIVLPQSIVGTDGEQHFYACFKLENITLPSSIKTIESSMFHTCGNLKNIVFPTVLETIEKSAFAFCGSLTEVIIPTTVNSVEEGAFEMCESLERVVWNPNLKEIMQGTFFKCNNLSTFENFPQSTKFIGDAAFGECLRLTIDVVSLASDGTMGEDPFWAVSVGAFEVPDNNQQYSSLDGVLFNKDKTELIRYNSGNQLVTNYTVPSSVTKIANFAFVRAIFSQITLPSGLIDLGYGSFYMSGKLSSIELPDGIETLEDRTFRQCFDLTSVKLPANLKSIEEDCFSFCHSLSELTLPNKLEYLGNSIFYGAGIKTLHLPASVNLIAPDAFLMVSLDKLTVDKFNSSYIDEDDGTLVYSKDKKYLVKVTRKFSANEFVVPAETDTVMTSAIQYCNTPKVSFLNPNCYLSKGCFTGNKIQQVILPANIDTIQESLFMACGFLKKCTFPEGLRHISRGALTNACLEKVVLPASLLSIGIFAFNVEYLVSDTIRCLANEAPDAYQDEETSSFGKNENLANKILVIPIGARKSYESAPCWKLFGEIVESDAPVSVQKPALSSVKVISWAGNIIIEGSEKKPYSIYNIQGSVVSSGITQSNRTTISLNPDLYIVKTSGHTVKVEVK